MRHLSKLLLVAFVFFEGSVLLEASIFVLNEQGLIHTEKPTYSPANATSHFWADIDPVFGVWHPAEASLRHAAACFDVQYRANSYGARDKERPRRSLRNRVVVLGDSFVEGWGVADADRFTNRLEDTTGIAHLNFGTSGSFGTVQYLLLYQSLAKQFDHEAVLVVILPVNDFQDNDLEFGRRYRAERYRPYFVGRYPAYELIYHDKRNLGARASLIEKLAREFTYTFHAKEYVENILRARDWERTSYDRFSEAQFNLMRYSLEKLVAAAGERDVYVVTIPVQEDLERYQRSGRSPLGERLKALSQESGFWYGDLLPYMHARRLDWSQYYLPCDRHWSAFGHSVAADYLRERLPLYRDDDGT